MGYLQLFLILLVLISQLFIIKLVERRVVLTPAFCFTVSFIPQILFAFLWVDKWEILLSIDTMIVYIGGIIVFNVFSILFHYFFTHNKKKAMPDICDSTNMKIVDSWKLIVCLAFQTFALYVTIKELLFLGNGRSLVESINYYGFSNKLIGLRMSGFAGKLNLISGASGYIWVYYLLHSWIYRYRNHSILLMANIVLSVIHLSITGSRGGVLVLFLAGLVAAYFVWSEKSKWRRKIPIQYVAGVFVVFIIIIVSFQSSLALFGRTTSGSLLEYIGRYLSAELKNLDIYIRAGKYGPVSVDRWQTLNSILAYFAKTLGFQRAESDAFAYLTVNGFALGNVYTAFYTYVYDLGLWGIIVFSPIMAFVCELSFYYAVYKKSVRFKINISKIAYAYICGNVLFSFFSNKFFEQVIHTGFVWYLGIWILLRVFLEGVSYSDRRLTVAVTERSIFKI